MLRISVIEENGTRVVLKLEGFIESDWVDELERECRRWLAANRKVILNFREIRFVNGAAATLLKRLEAEGVAIVECSAFIKALLLDGG